MQDDQIIKNCEDIDQNTIIKEEVKDVTENFAAKPQHIRTDFGKKPTKKKKTDMKKFAKNKFACSYCNYVGQSRHFTIIHERKHTGEKPFPCKVCDKSFASNSRLVAHARIHSDKHRKPYPCKNCDKSFIAENYLRLHEKKCTGQNGNTNLNVKDILNDESSEQAKNDNTIKNEPENVETNQVTDNQKEDQNNQVFKELCFIYISV